MSHPAQLVSRELFKVENSGLVLLQESNKLKSGRPGAECLRFAADSQIPSQTSEPNPT